MKRILLFFLIIASNVYAQDDLDNRNATQRYAFTGDKEEVVVIIPDTIDSIAQGAYSCCRELVAVSIPISVTYIDKWAFWGCKSLTTIEYEGTIDQWNNITKGKNWCEGVKECYVECADGEIELQ